MADLSQWRIFQGRAGRILGSERGTVLILVIVLSAIALAVTTTMLYIVTTATQVTGMQKRYRTAREAAFGGIEVVKKMINTQGNADIMSRLTTSMDVYGLDVFYDSSLTCQNKLGTGTIYSGLQAKVMTAWSAWKDTCNSQLTIDPAAASTYDIQFDIGTGTKYAVYAKIVHTVQGNTSEGYGGSGLSTQGGVVSPGSEIPVAETSSLYTIEMYTENSQTKDERAKFSVLYQY